MSDRRKKKAIAAGVKNAVAATVDSFQNFLTRLGIGTGNANDASRWGYNLITRNRMLLEAMYRGSWICRATVDIIAEDMTREGVEINSDDTPDALLELEREAMRLQIWDRLCETIKWSRLFGGAIGVLLIDGQDFRTPLRPESIRKGQFKGVVALDRWLVQPGTEIVREFGPHLGQPEFYDVVSDNSPIRRGRIHYSRVIRLDGGDLPYYQRLYEQSWGVSSLEPLYDRLVAFDSTTAGAAQLVYKAHLRTVKIKGLREIVAMGGKPYEGLLAQINVMRAMQSNEGITLMDAEDEFDTHQYAFSGLDKVLLQFGQQISGATGIPLVRMFGQSPAGLNATGESDLTNYYDGIKQKQESRLRSPVELVYRLLYISVFGREPPKSFTVKFRPLWQMSDDQLANITNTRTAAVVAAYDSQLIDRATGMRELKTISEVTGAFANIDDKAIKDAENDPPPSPAALGLEVPVKNDGPEKEGSEGPGENGES